MRKFLGIMLLLFTFVLFTLMFTLQREAALVMPSAPFVFGWGKFIVAIPLVWFAFKLIKRKKGGR